jgi:hypothetical protein
VAAPYREHGPLSTRIAPDRRRQIAATLLGVGMLLGVVAWELVRHALSPGEVAEPSEPRPDPPRPLPPPAPAPPPVELTSERVGRVIAAERAALMRACWERREGSPTQASFTVDVSIAPSGAVVATSSRGEEPLLRQCVEQHIQSWTFPVLQERTTVTIPFRFARE